MSYGHVPKERSELIKAFIGWTTGRFEEINGKNKPLLKEDTPKEIVEKRDRYFELILLDTDDDEGQ